MSSDVGHVILDISGRNSYSLGMKAIVSEKGQVTIPKVLRDKLGLRPGTVLDFNAVEGKLVGVKKEQDDRIGRWLGKGTLPGGLAVDDYLRRVRG
jgi:AbrB family looped-hinge helix DNA binding protein